LIEEAKQQAKAADVAIELAIQKANPKSLPVTLNFARWVKSRSMAGAEIGIM